MTGNYKNMQVKNREKWKLNKPKNKKFISKVEGKEVLFILLDFYLFLLLDKLF